MKKKKHFNKQQIILTSFALGAGMAVCGIELYVFDLILSWVGKTYFSILGVAFVGILIATITLIVDWYLDDICQGKK